MPNTTPSEGRKPGKPRPPLPDDSSSSSTAHPVRGSSPTLPTLDTQIPSAESTGANTGSTLGSPRTFRSALRKKLSGLSLSSKSHAHETATSPSSSSNKLFQFFTQETPQHPDSLVTQSGTSQPVLQEEFSVPATKNTGLSSQEQFSNIPASVARSQLQCLDSSTKEQLDAICDRLRKDDVREADIVAMCPSIVSGLQGKVFE